MGCGTSAPVAPFQNAEQSAAARDLDQLQKEREMQGAEAPLNNEEIMRLQRELVAANAEVSRLKAETAELSKMEMRLRAELTKREEENELLQARLGAKQSTMETETKPAVSGGPSIPPLTSLSSFRPVDPSTFLSMSSLCRGHRSQSSSLPS